MQGWYHDEENDPAGWVVNGQWSMANGQWSMVNAEGGRWSLPPRGHGQDGTMTSSCDNKKAETIGIDRLQEQQHTTMCLAVKNNWIDINGV
jgi:hypothetical protein